MTHTLQAPINSASEAIAYAVAHLTPADLETGEPALIWLGEDRLIAFVKAEPKPTPDYVDKACNLKERLDMAGLRLADFILLGEGSYYSFAEERKARI